MARPDDDPYDFDLDPVLDRIARDPLSGAASARDACRKRQGGYQKSLHKEMAAAFAVAQALAREKRLLNAFVNQPFFRKFQRKPRTGRPRQILTTALKYHFDATTRQENDRCLKYAGGLEKFFVEDQEAVDISHLIEVSGGIDKLYEESTIDDDDDDDDNDTDPEPKDGDEAGDESEPVDPSDISPTTGESGENDRAALFNRVKNLAVFNLDTDLVIEMSPTRLDKALTTNEKDLLRITAENVGRDVRGFTRIRALKLIVTPSQK